jgi:hypothetical protein
VGWIALVGGVKRASAQEKGAGEDKSGSGKKWKSVVESAKESWLQAIGLNAGPRFAGPVPSVFNCGEVLDWGAISTGLKPLSALSDYQFSKQTTSASDSSARKIQKTMILFRAQVRSSQKCRGAKEGKKGTTSETNDAN